MRESGRSYKVFDDYRGEAVRNGKILKPVHISWKPVQWRVTRSWSDVVRGNLSPAVDNETMPDTNKTALTNNKQAAPDREKEVGFLEKYKKHDGGNKVSRSSQQQEKRDKNKSKATSAAGSVASEKSNPWDWRHGAICLRDQGQRPRQLV